MKITLDAGHGGKDPGACKGGRQEKTDVLNMVLRVGQILSGNGAEVHYTRTTDVFDSPDTKAKKGNQGGAELFASFHRNSATSTDANGYETLVYSNDGKAKVVADAANSIMAGLGFRNRGTKIRKELAVLRGTTMQAVLFEMGFISNDQDNARYDNQFEQIAQGLAGAILEAFGKNVGNTAPAPNPQPASAPTLSGGGKSRYTGGSVVECCKHFGIAYDYPSRAGYAAQLGISGYSGSVTQNVKLIELLNSKYAGGSGSSGGVAVIRGYTGASLVDALKHAGMDSSMPARRVLAAKYGISNYSGAADQNTRLLNILCGR